MTEGLRHAQAETTGIVYYLVFERLIWERQLQLIEVGRGAAGAFVVVAIHLRESVVLEADIDRLDDIVHGDHGFIR